MKLAEKIDRYELMFLQGYIPKEYDTKANYNDYLHLCEFGIDATEYFIELYNKQSNRQDMTMEQATDADIQQAIYNCYPSDYGKFIFIIHFRRYGVFPFDPQLN